MTQPAPHLDTLAGVDSAPDLAAAMGDLARYLHAAESPDQVVSRVLQTCVAIIDGCAHAGITVLPSRRGNRLQATDPEARALDEVQDELAEGPGPYAVRTGCRVTVPDLAGDPRWPRLGPRAASLGVWSMLTCPLFTDERTVAALNLYGTTPHAFTTADEDTVAVLSAHASVALDSARTRAQLGEAIRTREVIGEAVGILKERHQMTSEEAFDQLRVASQRLNVKLRVIAEQLTSGRRVPE